MTMKLPGLIDPHVHLRDPGQTEKEDFFTGTAAALAGGFTAVIDMPNNKVPITTLVRLKEKEALAKKQIVSDIGFYFGTLGDNLTEFDKISNRIRHSQPSVIPAKAGTQVNKDEKWIPDRVGDDEHIKPPLGLKIYLNQTTGNFLLNKTNLPKIFERWPEELPILFHAEDTTFDDVLSLLKKFPRPIHLCHLSTAYELKQVIKAKKAGYPVTCGVTPHHLFLSVKHFKKYGSFAMMRPPLMPQSDIDFLWNNLDQIDMIESDHAPHTLLEKNSATPPNGIPGLETTLPLLLTAVSQKALRIEDVIRLCHTGPKKLLGIEQGENTYIEVDPDEEYLLDQTQLFTKAKWTPFNGWKMKGRLQKTVLHGKTVFSNGQLLAAPGSGTILTDIF